MIKSGDQVKLKPAWMDEGDDQFKWIAIDDEEKGRVTITPIDSKLRFPPTYVVKTFMLKGDRK